MAKPSEKFFGVRMYTSVKGEAIIVVTYPVAGGDTSYLMRCGDTKSALDWLRYAIRRNLHGIHDESAARQA